VRWVGLINWFDKGRGEEGREGKVMSEGCKKGASGRRKERERTLIMRREGEKSERRESK